MVKHSLLPLLGLIILNVIILSPRNVGATGSPGPLTFTPPYPIGVPYHSGQNGVAQADATSGNGYVKATASGILSTAVQKSLAAIVFATSAQKFTGINQTGAVEVKGTLQNLHIASGTDSGAFIFAIAVTEDLNSNLTISKLIEQQLYLNSTARTSPSVGIDNTYSLNWVSGHIYRTAVFLSAEALAGGPGNTATAYSNFTLASIIWTAPTDFPSISVAAPSLLGVPLTASPGDTVTVNGAGFRVSETDKIKLIAIDSNGRPIKGGTNQVVVSSFSTGSTGSFQQTFKVPSNATPVPGTYAIRATNITDPDAVDAAITLSVPLVSPAFYPGELVSLLVALAAIPLVIRRIRHRAFRTKCFPYDHR